MNQLGFMHNFTFGVCMTNIVVAGSHNFEKQEPDSRFILQLQICFRQCVCCCLSYILFCKFWKWHYCQYCSSYLSSSCLLELTCKCVVMCRSHGLDHNQSYKLLRTNNKLKGYFSKSSLKPVPVLSPAEQDLNTENLKCRYLKKGS